MKEHVIDATGKALGRIASEAAVILQGKDSATYDPRKAGERVVHITNPEQFRVSSKKLVQKTYYRHSTRIGHLRTRTLRDELSRGPVEVIRRAVRRMLPKNKLSKKRMRRLKIG